MASPVAFALSLLCLCVIWNISYSEELEKVKVDVYYEALCPDSRRFFQRQMWSTYKKLNSRLDLNFIPYGNAVVRGSPDHWIFTCQHGPEECYGNVIQACVINTMNNTMDSLNFIVCAFNTNSQAETITNCIQSAAMQEKIQACANGTIGNNLEYEMAQKTIALDPPQTFIPWITINGKGSSSFNMLANYHLLEVVCKAFKVDVPDVCKKYRNSNSIFRRSISL